MEYSSNTRLLGKSRDRSDAAREKEWEKNSLSAEKHSHRNINIEI